MPIIFLIKYFFYWLLGISRKKPEEKKDDIVEAVMKAIPRRGLEAIEGYEHDMRIILKMCLHALDDVKMIHYAFDTQTMLSSIKLPAYGSYHYYIQIGIANAKVPVTERDKLKELQGAYRMAMIYLINLQGYNETPPIGYEEHSRIKYIQPRPSVPQPIDEKPKEAPPQISELREQETDDEKSGSNDPDNVPYDRDQY